MIKSCVRNVYTLSAYHTENTTQKENACQPTTSSSQKIDNFYYTLFYIYIFYIHKMFFYELHFPVYVLTVKASPSFVLQVITGKNNETHILQIQTELYFISALLVTNQKIQLIQPN